MLSSVCLSLLFSSLFGVFAPGMARRLPPAVGTWLLSVGGISAAAGVAATLAFLSSTLLGQASALAELGHWSPSELRQLDSVGTPVSALAAGALAVLALRVAVTGVRQASALRSAHRLASALSGTGGELVVMEDLQRQAYAVPGRPGRIVVSTGMLRSLDAQQRRAVLAHERAHLNRHHHLHTTLARLAAAANPTLRALPAAVASAAERWADEDAGAACRRETVARALVVASGPSRSRSTVILAATDTDVAARVSALARPAPRMQLWRMLVLVGLLAATALSTVHTALYTDHLFDLAQYAYTVGR